MKRQLLLASALDWALAPWPEGTLKDFPGQIWWEDWPTSCADSGGSVYNLPVPPNDQLGHYDTSKARCGYDCRPVSGNCVPNCGDLWCTGFGFDDWTNANSAQCPGTFCLDRPVPAPAPCDCQGPHHCASWGDPHMVSFDGWRWDFPGEEEYEVFGMQGGLRVTSDNWDCNQGGATCMKRVNLWADTWGMMGQVNSGGSVEIDKEGRLYVGCTQVDPRNYDSMTPYVVPGTNGELVLKYFSRPDGEWVDSHFVFEYTAPGFGTVEVRVEAPIGKWTTSAYITYTGCVCNVTGLCQGPLPIWDCYKGGTDRQDVPAGCGALPPQGDPKRKSGLCVTYANQDQTPPPDPFPPRDCASLSVRQTFDYCCAKFSAGNCGTVPKSEAHAEVQLPRTSFYQQCLWDNCVLNADRSATYCLGHVDSAAAQDKTGDCGPQQTSPTAPAADYVPTPQPQNIPACVGEWSACDVNCNRQWNWAPGNGVSCPTPDMPECASGDGACPTPQPPPSQGTCNDGIRGQGESGVDCGGPCAKRCVDCVPVKASTYIVDGTMCGAEESCAEIVFAPPQPPAGDVGCRAPCDIGEEYCEQGSVYLQRPGYACGSPDAERLSGSTNVHARGVGVEETGGVGVLKSDVWKLNRQWDIVNDGQPTVCYQPTPDNTVQQSSCGVECVAEWRREGMKVRNPNAPEPYRPKQSLVEKKNPTCVDEQTVEVGIDGNNGTYGCDLVVTVRDTVMEVDALSTCGTDNVCGYVDLLKQGAACGSTLMGDYIARGLPARAVADRSDLRRADVPSAMIHRAWGLSAADHVCWRPRVGAAAKGVTGCRAAVDDCSLLAMPPAKDEEEDSGSTDSVAIGVLVTLGVLALAAVVALLAYKSKMKKKASPGAIVHTPPGMKDGAAPYSEATSLNESPRRVVNVNVDAVDI